MCGESLMTTRLKIWLSLRVLFCCADEEAEELIRRGADAASRLGSSTGIEDRAHRSAFNTLKLIRQLLIADRRSAHPPTSCLV